MPGRLMQEGEAGAVKLEGGVAVAPTIRRLVQSGIPVMAHIGFTPQSVHQIGLRKQGKDEAGARQVMEDAQAVQEAGAFAVVLELIPDALAAQITAALVDPDGRHRRGSGVRRPSAGDIRPDRPAPGPPAAAARPAVRPGRRGDRARPELHIERRWNPVNFRKLLFCCSGKLKE